MQVGELSVRLDSSEKLCCNCGCDDDGDGGGGGIPTDAFFPLSKLDSPSYEHHLHLPQSKFPSVYRLS